MGSRIVHYYCFGSSTDQTFNGPTHETIIRSLCCKLAWNDGDVAAPAAALFDRCDNVLAEPPNLKDWETLLCDLASSGSGSIVFIIDALDECKTAQEQRNFLHFVDRLLQQCPMLHIMFSSRPQVPVSDYFHNSLQTFQARSTQANDDMADFLQVKLSAKEVDPQWKNSIFCKINASHDLSNFYEVRPAAGRIDTIKQSSKKSYAQDWKQH